VPDTIDVAHLKGCLSLDGPESLIAHPADVTRIFAGVTLDTIRTIKRLYCSRLGRSIRMVWKILNDGEQGSETHAISYEAVWAVCLFFEEHRRASVDISVERGKETWWLGIVSPDFMLSGSHTPSHRPAIACLVNVQTQRVLSFRIGMADILQELIGLVLYDALAAQRRPQRLAHAGLLWHLPQRIVTEGALSLQYSTLCQHAGLAVEPITGTQPVLQALRETWAAGLAGRTLSQSQCTLLLDTYLNTMHTYGPVAQAICATVILERHRVTARIRHGNFHSCACCFREQRDVSTMRGSLPGMGSSTGASSSASGPVGG